MLIESTYYTFTDLQDLLTLYNDTINTVGSNAKYNLEMDTSVKDGLYTLNIKIYKKNNIWMKEGYFSIN